MDNHRQLRLVLELFKILGLDPCIVFSDNPPAGGEIEDCLKVYVLHFKATQTHNMGLLNPMLACLFSKWVGKRSISQDARI